MKVKTRVTVKVTYECGKCGNVQVRTFESQDGLLLVPEAFCGCCVKNKGFSLMSASVSDAKAINVEEDGVKANPESRAKEGLGGSDQPAASGTGAAPTGAPKG